MKTSEKIELLEQWQYFAKQASALKQHLSQVLGSAQNMPFVEHYDDLYQAYTALVAQMINDQSEWLEWFAWENNFGHKALEAGYDGRLKPIKTLDDLLWLIEDVA